MTQPVTAGVSASVTVLAVEAKPRGTAVVTVDHGGESESCTLPLESVVQHGLHGGAALDEPAWRSVRAEGQRTLATRRGLDLLGRRHRTERELREALERRFDAGAVEAALARLRELGYLDDTAWATSYVASPRAAGRGTAWLRRELRQRGIADGVAARAVAEHDEEAAAHEAAERRARSLRDLDPQRRRRRLYDFLRRRGFAADAARVATEAALGDLTGDDGPGISEPAE